MDEETGNDQQLSAEQLNLVKALSGIELKTIDKLLLKNTDATWRKVARVVGSTMKKQKETHAGIPDVFYAQRVKTLVERGLLESHGNLNRMRNSEVRRLDQT